MTIPETAKYADHVRYLSDLLHSAVEALEQLERQNAKVGAENERLQSEIDKMKNNNEE